MPVIEQIVPSRGKEFWDTLDPDNMKEVLEAVKEEVKLNAKLTPESNFLLKSVRQTRADVRDSLLYCHVDGLPDRRQQAVLPRLFDIPPPR